MNNKPLLITQHKRFVPTLTQSLLSQTFVYWHTLSYPLRFIRYIAANTPIIANNNSKLGICVGESVGLCEGV